MVEAICLASGPSLTLEDVEIARQWRQDDPSRLVIVVNTTFRKSLWADVLFGMDSKWWNVYAEEAKATFKGMLVTSSIAHVKYKLVDARTRWPGYQHFGNSGAGAIRLAMQIGASRIYLLGYDSARTHGKSHHHGDHPKGLGNAGSIGAWPGHFEKLSRFANKNGVTVINCSSETCLKCFERMPLGQALQPIALAA